MATFTGLIILFFMSVATVAFGSDMGHEYIEKVHENSKEVAIRLARLDLVSYLFTSVPLVGGLMIVLGRDPNFIVHLSLATGLKEVSTIGLGIIASFGIGLGIARRRWTLRIAASR